MSDVIRLFLDDCPMRLRAIKAAVDARDDERSHIEAHGLKGAAGNLSATGLFDAAQRLERLGAEARFDAADAAWRRPSNSPFTRSRSPRRGSTNAHHALSTVEGRRLAPIAWPRALCALAA